MNETKIYKKIHALIRKNNLLPEGSKIILGLSGGPDSVFLLHILSEYQKKGTISLIAAHLDHQWRPNSHEDVQFCQNMAKAVGARFVSAKFCDLGLSLKFNGSKEDLGRQARRHFFTTVKKECSADLIALAHHQDDQLETFFIRLARGASLTGLTCMKPRHGDYIRPLLQTCKQEILEYLNSNNIAYLQDPTNSDDTFLRNRIRNSVLPALAKSDNRFFVNCTTAITRLQETEQFLDELTTQNLETCRVQKTEVFGLNLTPFLKLQPEMRYRVLLRWLIENNLPFTPSQGLFDEIMRFLAQPGSATHKIGQKWAISKKKGLVFIENSHL